MLLTLTTTHQPATDLGFLLHKHPNRVHEFRLPFGAAHVFYPDATPERCTAALLVDVDPIGLVRGRPAGSSEPVAGYVNDRPYAASSFLSVALARVLGSALAGRSTTHGNLAQTDLPLEANLPVLPCHGGEVLVRRLFEPLGYRVVCRQRPLDNRFPEWGISRYFDVTLERTTTVSLLLTHLYVLVPVLDDEKHYWVGDAEVEKLLRRGAGWIEQHPERELIVDRYLKHQGRLTRAALARLTQDDEPDPDEASTRAGEGEARLESGLGLQAQRVEAVCSLIRASGARTVVDLGCGQGALLAALVRDRSLTNLAGMDVSLRSLSIARDRLHLDRMPGLGTGRVNLFQGSVLYRDARLKGFEAAALCEVIEHLDPKRLDTFADALFGFAKPGIIVVTTPNREYNARFPGLAGGKLRHGDHRFEWTRTEFEGWAAAVADRYGYAVAFEGVGPDDPDLGPPTQLAHFQSMRTS